MAFKKEFDKLKHRDASFIGAEKKSSWDVLVSSQTVQSKATVIKNDNYCLRHMKESLLFFFPVRVSV